MDIKSIIHRQSGRFHRVLCACKIATLNRIIAIISWMFADVMQIVRIDRCFDNGLIDLWIFTTSDLICLLILISLNKWMCVSCSHLPPMTSGCWIYKSWNVQKISLYACLYLTYTKIYSVVKILGGYWAG